MGYVPPLTLPSGTRYFVVPCPDDTMVRIALRAQLERLCSPYAWEAGTASTITPEAIASFMCAALEATQELDTLPNGGNDLRTVITDWVNLDNLNQVTFLQSDLQTYRNIHIELRGAVAVSTGYQNLRLNALDINDNILSANSIGEKLGGTTNWLGQGNNGGSSNYLRLEIPIWNPSSVRVSYIEYLVSRRNGVEGYGLGTGSPEKLQLILDNGVFSADSEYRVTGE